MATYYRRRRGTTPSFWKTMQRSQFSLAAGSMQTANGPSTSEPTIRELIAEYDRKKTPPAAHFVTVHGAQGKPWPARTNPV